MNDTIYWAVKLDGTSRAKLISSFPPIHPNKFAEHMTIIFKPSDVINDMLNEQIGTNVVLTVVGYAADNKGEAIVVRSNNIKRMDNGIAHITLSCADGIPPKYSNDLVQKEYDAVLPFELYGTIACFTKRGWKL
jgi:hypothetical protein